MRRNSTPYTLLVIPRPFPSKVVEGEHFFLVDARRLASSGANSSRDSIIEASSRVHGARSASRSSASSIEGSSSSPSTPSQRTKKGRPERFLPLAQVAGVSPRMVKVKWKRALGCRSTPGSRGENFILWILDDADGPQDLEEEERMEKTVGLLDRYAARNRKRQVNSSGESDVALVQSVEPSQPTGDDQPAADRSLRDWAITISSSPELGPTSGAEHDGACRSESNEGDSTPQALQVIPPSNRGEEPPRKSKHMQSWLPKPNRPDQVITHNYLPPRGLEPPRVEISALGEEEVKDILRRWEPFHCGASAADRLNSLYPPMYLVSMVARGMGLHEDYSAPVPTSTPKEDFL